MIEWWNLALYIVLLLFIGWALFLESKLRKKTKELEDFKRVRYFQALRIHAKKNPEVDQTEVQYQIGVYKFDSTSYYSSDGYGHYDFHGKSSQ